MARISFFKKLKLYRTYRRTILNEESILNNQFGLRIDFVNRMYTVVNVPRTEVDNYEVNTKDLDVILDRYVKDKVVEVGKFLDSKGLQELYDLYELKRVGKYSKLFVLGFKPFKTHKMARNIFYLYFPILLLIIIFFAIKFL